MKKFSLIFILILAVGILIYGDSYIYSGTKNAGNFLKIPIGARVEALGGSYTGISDDIEGINSNPAGLALEDRFLFGATLGTHYLETDYNFFGVMLPTEYMGNIALSAIYLNYGTQDEYDENGSLIGDFTCYDAAATLTISDTIFSGFYAGFNARYIETKLGDYKGGTFAGDLGILWNPKFYRNMFLGAVVKNFGISLKLDEMANELPIIYGIGIGVYPVKQVNHRLMLSVDYEKSEDTPDVYKFGMEYFLYKTAAFRLGMEMSEFSEKEMSYGIGLTRWNIGLNYSISSHESLENLQKITILYSF
ncbi:MAG: PorV/PorQ family protein [bacterium]|nr:PorV/PorQ family protein [bacterium]